MKKISLFVFMFFVLIIVVKYYVSSYNIEYKVDGFSIVENYDIGEFYIEIINEDKVYNMKIFENRSMKRGIISSVEVFKSDNYECLYPISKKYEMYPVCSNSEGEAISYHLVDDEIVESINKLGILYEESKVNESSEFEFMDNIESDEYIAVWKYNGFYILNSDGVKTVDIFKKDRYSNDLSIRLNDKILLPNYDEDLIFSSFILLDIVSGEYEKIKTDFEISYDAYIAGNDRNDIYLFDNKSLSLYSINMKNGKVKLVGNSEKGYYKIENYSKEEVSVNEFKNDKITFFNESDEGNVLTSGGYYHFEENDSVKIKFINDTDFNVVYTYEDNIYYLKDDNLYKYSSAHGSKVLLHYFELNFNDKNRIFIYNK